MTPQAAGFLCPASARGAYLPKSGKSRATRIKAVPSKNFVEKSCALAHLHAMSRQEYEELLRAMERVRAEHAATPEKARAFLREEGLLTEAGELTAPYRPMS